jgi:hypothetical protein
MRANGEHAAQDIFADAFGSNKEGVTSRVLTSGQW